MRPPATGTLPQPFGDQRRLIVAVEVRMIPHRLLHANEVDVESPDRIDGPLEVVVALPIRSFVNVESGNAKGRPRDRRGGGAATRGTRQGHDATTSAAPMLRMLLTARFRLSDSPSRERHSDLHRPAGSIAIEQHVAAHAEHPVAGPAAVPQSNLRS